MEEGNQKRNVRGNDHMKGLHKHRKKDSRQNKVIGIQITVTRGKNQHIMEDLITNGRYMVLMNGENTSITPLKINSSSTAS